MSPANFENIRAAVERLEQASEATRYQTLVGLVVGNGGRWDLPATGHTPIICEVQVFGVPAFAERPCDLPASWLRAAKQILKASAPFNCPHWPGCQCPGGTVRPECPMSKDVAA